jgi:poly(3-hydroxybutyrate) depolymerase
MKWRHMAFAVPIFLAVAAVSGYMTRAGSDNVRGRMLVDARQRTYDLHVPANYDGTKDAPFLLALHGRLGTGSGQHKGWRTWTA